MLCDILGVSKSRYYEWAKQPTSKRQQRIQKLDYMITEIFNKHKSRYGSTRIYHELKLQGVMCTRKIIAKRMKAIGLVAKARKKCKVTTDSNHKLPVAPNILDQNFSTEKANEKWLTDITYIPTQEGWLYLCVFIDLFSRAIVGWSMGKSLKAELVTDALTMALYKRKFPRGVIVHSDRGSQYCSNKYQKLLKANDLICSMSGKGCCYDNAAMESFFHTLKVELVHDEKYKSREEAKTSIASYIECYYNRKRRHSSINYCIPEEYDNLMRAA